MTSHRVDNDPLSSRCRPGTRLGDAVCGYGAFLSVVVPASRKVALRIDAIGITLGGSPLRYKATTRVIQ
jgi:hypothetical protein